MTRTLRCPGQTSLFSTPLEIKKEAYYSQSTHSQEVSHSV